MDGAITTPHFIHDVPLQWGHGREAMDGGDGGGARADEGVLQWGHGREAMDGRSRSSLSICRLCFNGATAVRPWMAAQAIDVLSECG